MNIDAAELELQFGICTMQDEGFVTEYGIVDEAEISVHMTLDGGKKKKKKIAHKRKPRPKAVLQYFPVEASGKIKRLK